MEDYIDVLLEHLSDQRPYVLDWKYAVQVDREKQASAALEETFTAEQRRLFRAYEDARNASASISEDAYARQAFLLAREIYR